MGEEAAAAVEELAPSLEQLGRAAGRYTRQATEAAKANLVAAAQRAYALWKKIEPAASAAGVAAVGYQAFSGNRQKDETEIPFGSDLARTQMFLQTAYRVPQLQNVIYRSLVNNESEAIRAWIGRLRASLGKTESAIDSKLGEVPGQPWLAEGASTKAALIREVSAFFGQKGSPTAVLRVRMLIDLIGSVTPNDCDQYLQIYAR